MDLHQRQQFDFLLQTATERFVARMEERYRGPQQALAALRGDPATTTATLATFVAAIFRDFLLDDADGAAFVLRAVPRRSIAAHRAAVTDAATVEDLMATLARGLFAELLLMKTLESLEQHAGYEAVQGSTP
jgi:hypothetical protein